VSCANADESYCNLLNWLDRETSKHLLADCKTTYIDGSTINGVLHYMSDEQCNGFLWKISSTLEEWRAAFCQNNTSCGTVLAGISMCWISTVSVGDTSDQ